jgi:hypothetical protein
MDHHRYRHRHQKQPYSVHSHSHLDARYEYSKTGSSLQVNSWSPFGTTSPSNAHEERNSDNKDRSFGECLSSVKRQREHHVILASSQDDDCDCGDDHCDDNSMMDCDNDIAGPNKRRRLACAFPFDSDGRIIQQQQEQINPVPNELTVLEECAGMNISNKDEGIPPVEWWRKNRHLVTSATAVATNIDAKSIVEQEASSFCSAMDTSVGDDEICCHICQSSFPLPIIPSVRDVMPVNALLNYFSPLNKKTTVNGDVAMAMNNSHHYPTRAANHHNWENAPACCPCCDRPSCPECRRECQACQKSFCSFCSIARDDVMTHCAKANSSFCLDCYDQLR